jgi:hypothetical protein
MDDILEVTYRKPNRFVSHLENASKIVDSWPLWKQSVLGGLKLFYYQKRIIEEMQNYRRHHEP